MSTEAWIGLVGVGFAAVALVLAAWIGLKQIMVSSPAHTGSNTEVIMAILSDSNDREEKQGERAWEFVGHTLDELQAQLVECVKGRHDEAVANFRLNHRVDAMQEVLAVQGRQLKECQDHRVALAAADATQETPR